MNRKVIGIAVVVLWVAGLLFLYKRNGTHSPQESLVQAGMRVSPEVYYYSVQKAGAQVGVASSSVDTTKQRIVAVDFLRGAIPVGEKTVKVEARSEARFTRGMRLRDFVVKAIGDMTPFTVRGVMQEGEDKTLRVTTTDGRRKPVTAAFIRRWLMAPTRKWDWMWKSSKAARRSTTARFCLSARLTS